MWKEITEFLANILPLLYVLMGILTLYVVYVILKYFGTFEGTVNVEGSAEKIRKDKADKKKRDKEKVKLEMYTNLCNYFRGIFLPENKRVNLKYYLDRLDKRSVILDRMLTPEEYQGRLIFVLLCGLLCMPIGFLFNVAWFIGGALIIYALFAPATLKADIKEEDAIIDIYFIDLYLLLYSKLRQGSKARLSQTVESYIDTLQNAQDLNMKRVMLRFSQFFLNNLSMYPDHEAVPMLRQRYKSSTIINFCNVASQALQGIDNADTLLTFKMNLVEKKSKAMRKKARKMQEKASHSIYAIYILLVIFVVLSWASKI
jgi:hypothetical protein